MNTLHSYIVECNVGGGLQRHWLYIGGIYVYLSMLKPLIKFVDPCCDRVLILTIKRSSSLSRVGQFNFAAEREALLLVPLQLPYRYVLVLIETIERVKSIPVTN